ncbi:hypothetical protein [Bartonella sp. DGB1]|uniref:hypothetical protein n=1 Tax=Bartonella sp. DGB1 TaxID=3239807 RepID=UPI0035268451
MSTSENLEKSNAIDILNNPKEVKEVIAHLQSNNKSSGDTVEVHCPKRQVVYFSITEHEAEMLQQYCGDNQILASIISFFATSIAGTVLTMFLEKKFTIIVCVIIVILTVLCAFLALWYYNKKTRSEKMWVKIKTESGFFDKIK